VIPIKKDFYFIVWCASNRNT